MGESNDLEKATVKASSAGRVLLTVVLGVFAMLSTVVCGVWQASGIYSKMQSEIQAIHASVETRPSLEQMREAVREITKTRVKLSLRLAEIRCEPNSRGQQPPVCRIQVGDDMGE